MNAVSSDFVPIPARKRPVVFQLAGGSRDHYTSRAKSILPVTASPLFNAIRQIAPWFGRQSLSGEADQ